MLKTIAGALLVVWGYLDGIKYHIEARKIARQKSSKGHSRWFINLAMGNDLYRMFYFFFVDNNYYVLTTTIIAIIFMLEMFWMQYKYYPYHKRGLINFKRPNVFLYFLNSCIPNSLRKHL